MLREEPIGRGVFLTPLVWLISLAGCRSSSSTSLAKKLAEMLSAVTASRSPALLSRQHDSKTRPQPCFSSIYSQPSAAFRSSHHHDRAIILDDHRLNWKPAVESGKGVLQLLGGDLIRNDFFPLKKTSDISTQ